MLLEVPFKGDEAPLRAMEHAEIISINTHHGIVKSFILEKLSNFFQVDRPRYVPESLYLNTSSRDL